VGQKAVLELQYKLLSVWKEFSMRPGFKFAALVVAGVLCLSALSVSDTSHKTRKSSKKQQPAPLPSGPQGPVPQVPLDSVPASQPQVSYQNGQLSIVAPNSTLGDILRAVRKQTAAEMDIPSNATERVVTHLGPGPARDVMAELLNGSRFNYVLLGSQSDANLLTRVVLVAKSGADTPGPNPNPQAGQPGLNQPPNTTMPQDAANVQAEPEQQDAAEETPEENQDQANEVEQPAPPEAPGIKTPQQLLQEMQQRQLQMQQQQPPGQPPVPGQAYPQQVPPQPPQQQ
jgi:hypothetical protein